MLANWRMKVDRWAVTLVPAAEYVEPMLVKEYKLLAPIDANQ